MKHAITTAAVLLASSLGLGLAERSAHADGPAWRCVDEPGQQDCQEALINDIEDLTLNTWPAFVTITMPAIPYTCGKLAGGPVDPRFAPGPVSPRFTARPVSGWVAWQTTWTGIMRSFLIGRHTADADLSLSVAASVGGTPAGFWPGNTANFLFDEGGSEVQSPSGPTGVVDLGAVAFATTTGSLWSATLALQIELGDGNWSCTVGFPGQTVVETGSNGEVNVDFPIALTGTQDRLAEAVRNQFRTSVRVVVTGSP